MRLKIGFFGFGLLLYDHQDSFVRRSLLLRFPGTDFDFMATDMNKEMLPGPTKMPRTSAATSMSVSPSTTAAPGTPTGTPEEALRLRQVQLQQARPVDGAAAIPIPEDPRAVCAPAVTALATIPPAPNPLGTVDMTAMNASISQQIAQSVSFSVTAALSSIDWASQIAPVVQQQLTPMKSQIESLAEDVKTLKEQACHSSDSGSVRSAAWSARALDDHWPQLAQARGATGGTGSDNGRVDLMEAAVAPQVHQTFFVPFKGRYVLAGGYLRIVLKGWDVHLGISKNALNALWKRIRAALPSKLQTVVVDYAVVQGPNCERMFIKLADQYKTDTDKYWAVIKAVKAVLKTKPLWCPKNIQCNPEKSREDRAEASVLLQVRDACHEMITAVWPEAHVEVNWNKKSVQIHDKKPAEVKWDELVMAEDFDFTSISKTTPPRTIGTLVGKGLESRFKADEDACNEISLNFKPLEAVVTKVGANDDL